MSQSTMASHGILASSRFMAPQPECALPQAHQSWQGSTQTWQRHGKKGIWNTRRAQDNIRASRLFELESA